MRQGSDFDGQQYDSAGGYELCPFNETQQQLRQSDADLPDTSPTRSCVGRAESDGPTCVGMFEFDDVWVCDDCLNWMMPWAPSDPCNPDVCCSNDCDDCDTWTPCTPTPATREVSDESTRPNQSTGVNGP